MEHILQSLHSIQASYSKELKDDIAVIKNHLVQQSSQIDHLSSLVQELISSSPLQKQQQQNVLYPDMLITRNINSASSGGKINSNSNSITSDGRSLNLDISPSMNSMRHRPRPSAGGQQRAPNDIVQVNQGMNNPYQQSSPGLGHQISDSYSNSLTSVDKQTNAKQVDARNQAQTKVNAHIQSQVQNIQHQLQHHQHQNASPVQIQQIQTQPLQNQHSQAQQVSQTQQAQQAQQAQAQQQKQQARQQQVHLQQQQHQQHQKQQQVQAQNNVQAQTQGQNQAQVQSNTNIQPSQSADQAEQIGTQSYNASFSESIPLPAIPRKFVLDSSLNKKLPPTKKPRLAYNFLANPTSVKEIYEEFVLGYNGQTPLGQMDAKYGKSWRGNSRSKESKRFQRRKRVCDLIENGLRKGMELNKVMDIIEKFRGDKSLTWVMNGNFPAELLDDTSKK